MTNPPPLHITISGAGLTSLTLALGLRARAIPFTIHERAPQTKHLNPLGGAGIGLSPNAERALLLLSPEAHQPYDRVANGNGEDYFQWINGITKEFMYKLWVGDSGFRGCRRSDLLGSLMGALGEAGGDVRFGREVVGVEKGEGEGCVVRFADGEEERADTLIAADGINSRLRNHLFPPPHPPVTATYTSKSSFRALLPLAHARTVLGPAMVSTRFMYNGPGAHIVTYPVANDTLLNVLVVISTDPSPSPSRRAKREEVERAFAAWHPDVRAIVRLLPAELDRWDIFDMHDAPVPRYDAPGGVCVLAGDAAHAAGPHLGAGAGMGIEDALLLVELLATVRDRLLAVDEGRSSNGNNGGGEDAGRRKMLYLEAAYALYTDLRYERTQWLVRETREMVDLLEWKVPAVAMDPEVFGREITWRFHQIWEYDVGKMVEDGKSRLAVAINAIDSSSV